MTRIQSHFPFCNKPFACLFACMIFSLLMPFSLSHANADPIQLTVTKNKVDAKIELAGGIETDFTITFEDSIGLNPDSIGISAEIVNVMDPSLLARLPSSLLTSLPSAFPMMITVEPPANMGLSFAGNAKVDIHTHNLEYTANTPLRLFKASLGQPFHDITVTTGAGSYRARGVMGGFSQFLVVVDLRPVTQVIQTKLDRLNNLLSNYATQIPAVLLQSMQSQLALVQSSVNLADYAQADSELKQFTHSVRQNSNTQLPNVWRSSRDIDNVAGDLIAQAETLGYSLRIAN